MKYLSILFLLTFAAENFGQSQKDTTKKKYNIFHATPKRLMRDFATDRPDATESSYTVDAGHFQVETDLFKTEHFKSGDVKIRKNYYNAATLKLGITNSLDVQIVVNTLQMSKINDGNTVKKNSQFGGLTLRAKQNVWGNDTGNTAFAVLPFINIPVGLSEKISGGIGFPFAVSLGHNWDLGAQVGADIENDRAGKNYHLNYLASATVAHPVSGKIDFFVEGMVTRETEIILFEYFLNTGVIFSPIEDIKIDMGIYYGLKSESSKTYFIGFSFRR